jgi:hypothetical protein
LEPEHFHVLKTNSLSILQEEPKGSGRVSRREAARKLLAGMAASTLPWGVASHPIWKHFEDEHLMDRAEAVAAEGKLHYLNAEQFALLTTLAEAIVPGSTKSNVASFVDLLLSVDEEKHQKEFASSLSRMEKESTSQYAKTFSALTARDVNTILEAASGYPAEKSEPEFRAAFENLKEWISGAYYSSEMGMRELGWTPDRVFAEFPGCSHSDGHK